MGVTSPGNFQDWCRFWCFSFHDWFLHQYALACNEPRSDITLCAIGVFDFQPLIVLADLAFSVRLSNNEFGAERQTIDQRCITDDGLFAECDALSGSFNFQYTTRCWRRRGSRCSAH